jgi:hypothetical protein
VAVGALIVKEFAKLLELFGKPSAVTVSELTASIVTSSPMPRTVLLLQLLASDQFPLTPVFQLITAIIPSSLH